MIEKIKDFFARSIYVIPVICSVFVLCGFVGGGIYYFYKHNPKITNIKNIATSINQADDTEELAAATEEEAAEMQKNPPKINAGSISTQSISTASGKAMVTSTGGGSADQTTKIQALSGEGPTSSFAYVDSTGQYPGLGDKLKNYLNSTLLHSNEISYLYEVDLIDCPTCEYGGYWTGSYMYSGTDITKAFGYITLNVAPYKASAYVEDYLKLTFSHEYGHHYTMYHRWVDFDIPSNQRFPAEYYNIRPLSYTGTAADYSQGWANCDAEVMAEDYSYFYSTYKYSGVAAAHGYPSSATKTYIEAMSGASSPEVAAPEPAAPEPESPPADTEPPTVNISSPVNGATISGYVIFNVDANDNVAVQNVSFAIDGAQQSTDSQAPFSSSWNSAAVGNGVHNLTVTAWDTSGNSAIATINFTVLNSAASSDTQNPTVKITAPVGDSFAWVSGDLRIKATANDNVAVIKMEFYIDDILAAEQTGATINRIWPYAGTPNNSYTLKAKAYDAAGNVGEASVTIIKS